MLMLWSVLLVLFHLHGALCVFIHVNIISRTGRMELDGCVLERKFYSSDFYFLNCVETGDLKRRATLILISTKNKLETKEEIWNMLRQVDGYQKVRIDANEKLCKASNADCDEEVGPSVLSSDDQDKVDGKPIFVPRVADQDKAEGKPSLMPCVLPFADINKAKADGKPILITYPVGVTRLPIATGMTGAQTSIHQEPETKLLAIAAFTADAAAASDTQETISSSKKLPAAEPLTSSSSKEPPQVIPSSNLYEGVKQNLERLWKQILFEVREPDWGNLILLLSVLLTIYVIWWNIFPNDGEYCYPTRAAQDLALALAPLLAAQVALLSQQASANPASQQQGPQQQARAITPDQAYSLASKLTPLLHQALRNAHLKKISAASEVGAGITFEDSSSAVHEQALQAALAEALLDDAPAVPQEKHRRALEAAIAAILLADHTVTSAHSDIDAKASQEVSPTSTTIRRAAAPSAQLEECLHDWIDVEHEPV